MRRQAERMRTLNTDSCCGNQGSSERTRDDRLAAEPLTVSTAQLRTSLSVHLRPINLVVYQGSHVLRLANLVLRGASRLDAFSGYPCRT
jgi:hypothetical protein